MVLDQTKFYESSVSSSAGQVFMEEGAVPALLVECAQLLEEMAIFFSIINGLLASGARWRHVGENAIRSSAKCAPRASQQLQGYGRGRYMFLY